ncbi:pentatricopeptide repeat-containing protein, putative [Ricinus communis]|uniref:Pentatricopeptide repeat-containing protein, putative n=1 Tax=Ricinus communis TaxID=3988 RepID=B9S795_RICCO|nr:pentatricopeptide repeat-containing protein, putative [Ricinus communis]
MKLPVPALELSPVIERNQTRPDFSPARFRTEQTVDNRNYCRDNVADKTYAVVMESSNHMEKALNQLNLELTTDLVVEVLLRLRFEEKIAFRFFMWAGRQQNYTHEPCAYNEMMDILSSTKYKVKQFRIVCDMLDYMKRNNKNIVPVEVLLTILRNYTQKYLTHVQKFAKKKRIRVKTQPEINAFNLLLDALCKCSLVEDAETIFKRVKNKNDRMDECSKLLGHMINSGCLPDVSTYKELMEGMCLAGKIDEAYRVLQEMGNKGYPPDIVTYNCFLKVLCENMKSDEALRLYGRMIEVDCLPSVQTYNMLISMYFEMGDPDGAFDTWDEMHNRGCAKDIDTYSVMIDGLFGCNKVQDACLLIEDVMTKGMKLPYQKFDSFLMKLSEIGDLQTIHKLSEHMRKYYNSSMARRFALNEKRKSMSFRGGKKT